MFCACTHDNPPRRFHNIHPVWTRSVRWKWWYSVADLPDLNYGCRDMHRCTHLREWPLVIMLFHLSHPLVRVSNPIPSSPPSSCLCFNYMFIAISPSRLRGIPGNPWGL
jgi:hypothetical protein